MIFTLTQGTETRLRTVEEGELQETLAGLDQSVRELSAGQWITPEQLNRRLQAKVDAAKGTQGSVPKA